MNVTDGTEGEDASAPFQIQLAVEKEKPTRRWHRVDFMFIMGISEAWISEMAAWA